MYIEKSKLILSIPHASTEIPDEMKGMYKVSPKRLEEEIRLLTDWDAEDLFYQAGSSITFPYSRVFCDVERFLDPDKEIMAKFGLGAFYTNCADGTPLRDIDNETKEYLLGVYNKHQDILAQMVSERLEQFHECIIIDAHTFPEKPLPYEAGMKKRPEICIGTDPFHTPELLLDYTREFLAAKGYEVLINKPFSGAFVPNKYYGENKNVLSVMIEINRGLYNNDNQSELFIRLKDDIREFKDAIIKADTGR